MESTFPRLTRCLKVFHEYSVTFTGYLQDKAQKVASWLQETYGAISKWGHGILDVIGIVGDVIPGAGNLVAAAADLLNTLWYLAEGDWTNAGLSALAIIPYLGTAAKGSKYLGKGLKYVDDILALASKYGDDVIQVFANHGDKAIKLFTKYGDKAVEVFSKYPDKGIELLNKYGGNGVEILTKYGDKGIEWLAKNEDIALKWLRKKGDEATKFIDDTLDKLLGKQVREEAVEAGLKGSDNVPTTSSKFNKNGKGRSHHRDQPEIEPGVVAKEKTVDGHQIKVLQDGRIVRCSKCSELREQFEEILEEYPELNKHLDEIEIITDPDLKARLAQELESKLNLLQQVKTDAKHIINDPTKSNKQLGRETATSRANSLGQPMTDDFQNMRIQNSERGGYYTTENFPGFTVDRRLTEENVTILIVSNPDDFMDAIVKGYNESGNPLHPEMKKRIKEWISEEGREFSSRDGVPGLHAEVEAVNAHLNQLTDQGIEITEEIIEQIQVATYRVHPKPPEEQGEKFTACNNCENILRGINILTEEIEH